MTIIKKVEHIGIAVNDINSAKKLYASLLGVNPHYQKKIDNEGIYNTMFKVGDSEIELLEPIDSQGPIANYINNHGEGIHHIAFNVSDINAEIKRLKKLNIKLIDEEPRLGDNNQLVAFIHPKSTHGVLIELCEDIDATL